MNDHNMGVDESSFSHKAKSLEALINGPLSSSLSRLSSFSRVIPADKDFHFYSNFDEFKRPVQEISGDSQSILETIGSSDRVWGKPMRLTGEIDGDEAYDWIVDANDEMFERFDMSMDEFERVRKKEEEIGRPLEPVANTDDDFQMVYGKKKKATINSVTSSLNGSVGESSGVVKVAERDKKASGTGKAKVPFHIPTVKKPQEEYNILVNNSNQPFEHVWLERSEDGLRFIHPLEKYSVLDFVDNDVGDAEPVKPLSMDETPFKFVEEVKDLKELAAKLRDADEFAVDLEHNQYRSFQGLTCLMQISTRTEDYIVDTLKLRIHVGPYLREVFKDPTKKKVMHGADRDIIWLQRDFGIYICNLFDTGQASRVLQLERNSLEFLLHHFCGVTANKEYQNAEWRLRPLPDEMIRYARDDTHYLLYLYDVMKIKLQAIPMEDGQLESSLVEVYRRSYDICMQLYEKDLLTEDSYLHIYGLQAASFNAVQLAIVAGLCEWRDVVARAEDESTGYVLPNKTLLEIAKEMPVTASKLRRALRSKHPYIEKNIGAVVSVIRHSMQNAAAYEAVAQNLKEGRLAIVRGQIVETSNGLEAMASETTVKVNSPNAKTGNSTMNLEEVSEQHAQNSFSEFNAAKIETSSLTGRSAVSVQRDKGSVMSSGLFPSTKISAAVQVSKKPSSGFGALLGKAVSKRKIDTENKAKEEIKLEQIRSSVNLPFQSFTNNVSNSIQSKASTETPSKPVKPASPSKLEDVIVLDDDSDEETRNIGSKTMEVSEKAAEIPSEDAETQKLKLPGSSLGEMISLEDDLEDEHEKVGSCGTKVEEEDEPMSLSELSTNFKRCFESNNANKSCKKPGKSGQASGGFMSLKPGFLEVKPFDYAAARKQVKFGEKEKKTESVDGKKQKVSDSSLSGKKKGSSGVGEGQKEGASEFSQGKRRQAFPASGNRSATFL